MITNATIEELEKALKAINQRYNGNITFRRIEQISKGRVRFTLTVHDSRGPGSRISPHGRRIKAACWHAHGHFFEVLFAINPEAFVRSQGKLITKDAGNWEDRNIGSQLSPFYFSEACDCN